MNPVRFDNSDARH